MKFQRRLADSLSIKLSFCRHLVALFCAKLITSTLWVSSLGKNEHSVNGGHNCEPNSAAAIRADIERQCHGEPYFPRGPGKERISSCSGVCCSSVCNERDKVAHRYSQNHQQTEPQANPGTTLIPPRRG